MSRLPVLLVVVLMFVAAALFANPFAPSAAVAQVDRPGRSVTDPALPRDQDAKDDDEEMDDDDDDDDDDKIGDANDISGELAMEILEEAVEDAHERGLKMNIAVVDAGGNLKAFVRMDGAWLGSIDIAIKKARTARYFDMPTGEIGKLSQPGGPLYNIEASNGGLITFPGGIPITNDNGEVVGAIGVSGSTVENDHAVAEAGLADIR